MKLEADDGPIDLSLHGSAPIVLSEVGWVVNSGLAVAMETDAWRATLDITGAEGSWQAEPERLGRVTGRWEGSLQLDSAALSAQGGVSVLIGGADVQLAFDAASVVNATRVVGEEWSIAAARIELTDGAVLQVELEPLAFRFDSPARLAVQLDRLFWSEYTLSPFVDLTVQQLHGDLASITTALQMHIPALQMGATAQVAGNLPGGPFTIGFDAEQLVAEPFFANLFPGGREAPFGLASMRLDWVISRLSISIC